MAGSSRRLQEGASRSSAGVALWSSSPAKIRCAPFVDTPIPGRVVEDVEPFRPELQIEAFAELEMPEQAGVQIAVTWTVDGDVSS